MFQGAYAVLVDCACLLARAGKVEVLFLTVAQHGRCNVRYFFIKQPDVARCGNVMVNGQRQEVEVVGDPCTDTDSGRRVPPMLYVALFKLPCRRPENVESRFGRIAVDERHNILELVAKTVRSSRLVER